MPRVGDTKPELHERSGHAGANGKPRLPAQKQAAAADKLYESARRSRRLGELLAKVVPVPVAWTKLPGSQGSQRPQNDAQILLGVALGDSELWHTPDDVAYATIVRTGHREHLRVRSGAFRQWLSRQFYDREKNAVGSQTMQDVINVLEGKARFDGPACPIFLRVAGHGGRVYLDLTDDGWRAIEVDGSGWRIVDEPPVRFRRSRGMLPLPTPERGGSVDELTPFVNVTDKDRPLVLAWLVAALRPDGPYPVLKLLGEQGAGKTTNARVLRAVIDPNVAPARSAPRTDHDLMIAASNGWIVCLDNLSYVTPELSDALCRLATGGGFSTRTLYTDDDETILVAERPIILNGIEDIGTRSDLLDRTLIVDVPRIESKRRRDEEAFWREFEQARPRILGALLDAASAAVRNLHAVKQSETEWPRMADFAQWAVAAEPALGLEPGEFLRAYSENRESANQTALESCPVATALAAALKRKGGKLEGTATELLNMISVGQDTRAKGWPKAPRVLSGMLSRLAPNLRASGITIEHTREGSGDDKRKVWRIESVLHGSGPPNRTSPQTSGPFDPGGPKALAEQLRARVARAARVAK